MANNLAPPTGPPGGSPGQSPIGGTNPSFFGAKTNKQQIPTGPDPEITRDLTRRLRVLEEQNTSLRKNLRVFEQNNIKVEKDLDREIAVVTSEIQELKSHLSAIKDELRIIVSELKETAKKEDFEVLDKYVKLWEPIKFCTQKDVENIVRRMINK